MRKTLFALLVLALGAGTASAQTAWADKIFGGKNSHDFGTVARGAQLVYTFPMKNIYSVPLEITSVRATCGCLTATPSTKVLRPNEIAQMHLLVDGRRFTGPKVVQVFVTVGPEFVSTATLHITANARPDVVLNPGQFNFGVVRQGQTPTQTLDVEYAGAFDWRITEIVRNTQAPYEVKVEELYRQPPRNRQAGRVGYRLAVSLKPDAPAGALNQELILKTNEPGSSQFLSVIVEGNIQATLTVSPSVVNLGKIKPGAMATHKVQVRGQRPFRIIRVDGLGDGVTAEVPPQPAQIHYLTLRYQPSQPGDLHKHLIIHTDLDQSAAVSVNLEAKVQP
ncbi:MAG TPA: DUF1573 domain-containing protein [Gemmataceae bacterium]|nr:DUF1573 domain-containing protein [Gemmataceae bacterium]